MAYRRNPRFISVAVLLSVVLFAAAAHACEWWYVQGVIDWDGLPGRPDPKTDAIYPVYRRNWEWHKPNGNGTLKHYTAVDADTFTPKSEQLDKDIPFGIMAGAVLLKKGDAATVSGKPDWYEIWAWQDTNNNGLADRQDTKEGQGPGEQQWQPLVHKTLPDHANEAFDLLKAVKHLKSGKTYLLLIRTFFNYQEGRSNLRYSSLVEFQWPQVRIGDKESIHDHGDEGWSVDGPRRYSLNWHEGVEDREVLWVRVNNPPARPIIP